MNQKSKEQICGRFGGKNYPFFIRKGEKPTSQERANIQEETKRIERAKLYEQPKFQERAVNGEKPD